MKLWLEILRRFVVVSAIALWLGGFTFYVGIVIPTGGQVIGHHKQGFITQQVTGWLNLIGIPALLILLWNALATRRAGRWVFRLMLGSWIVMAAVQVGLFILHRKLDHIIDPNTGRIIAFDQFESLHRIYGTISTVQWAFGMLYVFILLYAWTQPAWRSE